MDKSWWKRFFCVAKPEFYVLDMVSTGLLSRFLKEDHQEVFLYALVYMLCNCKGTLRVFFWLAQWSLSSRISISHMCLICPTLTGKNEKPYSSHAKMIIMRSRQSCPWLAYYVWILWFTTLTRQTGYALINVIFTDFRSPFLISIMNNNLFHLTLVSKNSLNWLHLSC